MNDDIHGELLDVEFRQILYIIKPLINNIDDHYRLDRYRVWLERLSSVHPAEKLERNRYLLELANQIHDQVLKFPFTHNPSKSRLPSLQNVLQMHQAQEQSGKDDIQWPYISPRRSQTEEPNSKKHLAPKESPTVSPPQKKKASKSKIVQPFQKIGKREQIRSEDSSWYDLSDSTLPGETHGDTEDKSPKKKVSASHQEEGLKTQEHFINIYEEEKALEETQKPGNQELEALKMRMKDLLEVKNALRDTQCFSEDRKKTLGALQAKLHELQQENSELKTRLDTQQKKFLEIDQIKSKELNDFKEKYSVLRQKEIEFLKQHHKSDIASLEKQYTGKISELEAKISSLTSEYETKIKTVKDSSLSLVKQKDDEIKQLQSQLQVKISQMSNEGNGEQVVNLRRCISKLDKILHKNEKEYSKKIAKLKQEIEVKEMTSQMQLQTQRAELIVRNTAAKQEELKNALNSLEGKYKKMLDTLQTHAFAAKKQDDKLIDELRGLLSKNNILY